ncbi:DUF2529 family protein [Pseudalkalibacillus salsuginis]|uniref:DUF2529 family protein n=1 Tax=Pseudalkalibacillus salsuginis TaxID=2910972 RepID=UPI001F1FD655|nr:DUF2529 family protein [Pseudalkalibacillus salsuginis]MCF6410898.1 DUF2529 domain-containing protein [Pseudalkalibacillus salsuginis]
MLKIFTTQLFGVFKKIQDHEDEKIEDCSRLLAQTITGNGTIHIIGFGELEGIASVIVNGHESLPACTPYAGKEMEAGDCILVFAGKTNDEQFEKLVHHTVTENVPIVSVAGVEKEAALLLNENFHIDTKLLNGLVPGDDGGRYGFPVFITALYVYYALYFNTKEMLEEYEI